LKELDNIVDHDTVLMIASGLGAQPYVKEEFRGGRSVVRLRNIQQALELLGILGDCEPYSVMAPQWNIRFESRDAQQRAVRGLKSAYYKTEDLPLFAHVMAGNTICLNVCQKLPRPLDPDADCVFPETNRVVKMRDLCVEKDSTPKQGYHEQAGVVIMAGPGIRAGFDLGECSTVDLAPTILHLLGLAVPEYMAGQILYEALEPTAARLTPRSATKALAAAVRA
jgi:hypothetical protein